MTPQWTTGTGSYPCPKLLRRKKATKIVTLNCRTLKSPIQQHLLAKLLSDLDTYCLPPRMSTKGPTNHKPISNVGSRESSPSKASGTKFCSLYQLSLRMLRYFKYTFRIVNYCQAVIRLPFGMNCSTFVGWFRRLVVNFQISPAKFESSISPMLWLFRKLCVSITHSYSGNRVNAHVLHAPCATFVLTHVLIRPKFFLPG